jgi:parallel beta-helix repeat protein
MFKKNLTQVLLTILVSIFVSVPVFAATYYASPNGSGTTCALASPCTLSTGLGKLVAGDTLYLRGGTYAQAVAFAKDGTAQNRITISGYPGETAIIDGGWTTPAHWGRLVEIQGDYVTLQDLTIRRSNSIGLAANGAAYVVFRRIKSEYNYENGIILWNNSDYGLIDNCTSYYDCYERVQGDLHSDGNWASCVSIIRGSDYGTIQNSTVSYCSGESLSMYTYSEGGNTYNTIQDNTVYHSSAPAVYISNCRNCTVQRNLLYMNTALSGSNIGIYMQDEYPSYMNNGNKILDNFVKGFNRNFYWGHAQSGEGLINTVIAGNTFVDAKSTASMKIDSGSHSGTIIKNNIFLQGNTVPTMLIASGTGLGFGYNNYNVSADKISSSAKGTGDKYGSDPLLSKAGSTGDGLMTADWFKLTDYSPCREGGTTVSGLTEDHWRTPRPQGSVPDMGGHEYGGTISTPPNPPDNLRVVVN